MTLSTPKGMLIACGMLFGGYFLVPMVWHLDQWSLEDDTNPAQHMEEIIPAGREQFSSLERISLKEEALQALLRGEKSLKQTVELFLWTNEQDSNTMNYVRRFYAGQSDEERVARQVISFAKFRRMANPDKIPQSKIDELNREFSQTNWQRTFPK
ncbi:MAG: hypothetical protein N2112_01065 [Gemmataceae bacterium]|jgi:hypothetical protein|nr:hypothetical protein [Gemmataceae bacterium]